MLAKSHPTRVRGLKHQHNENSYQRYLVAPHAGAWIETDVAYAPATGDGVAPHAGAWIETMLDCDIDGLPVVAPHAGAWIETRMLLTACTPIRTSHPTRVRGLKPAGLRIADAGR